MFDSFYRFHKVGVDKAFNKKYLKEIITYSFRSAHHYYLVEIEVYSSDIYIVKYYLKKHKHNPLKYNILTNEYRSSKVISTCIRIMLQIHSKNPMASFGFLGANTINRATGYEESKRTTKRFQVYKLAMYALFGTQTFTHYTDIEHSAYLMVSNKVKSVDEVKENAKKMFEDIFPELAE
ncbi:MAG: hypothetical protein ABJA76_15170 [Mucilaginibacter sp.]